MDVQRYLQRINYRGTLKPDLETLAALQTQHMQAVPFEDLSIHHNQRIILEEDLLYQKIVENQRGGFCYELNGLFARLLQEIGFKVAKLSAGTATGEGIFGPEYDHMALMVHLDEDYLVDVGFGDSFQKPLRFNERSAQQQGERLYQIFQVDNAYILMEQNNRDEHPKMEPQYRFTFASHELQEYQERCDFFQYSPASTFKKMKRCSRATPEGRITLVDWRLIITRQNIKKETELNSEEEYRQSLQEHFGISLPPSPAIVTIIRPENKNDFEAIAQVTEAAFRGRPYADGTEPSIIQRLRAANALTLSLVAILNGKVVGHAAFSSVMIDSQDQGWYGLGPISVLPELQRQGIGSQLIRKGLNLLHGQGARGCVLEGDPDYYQQFGFRSYPQLFYTGTPDPKYFMALPFYYQEIPAGKVEFHQAFYN